MGSFKGTHLEDRAQNDVEALELAVEPLVTSKRALPGHPSNKRGVGLSILRRLAQGSEGKFTLISGNAAMDNDGCCALGHGCRYNGTFAAFEFSRAKLDENFEALLEKAKSYTDEFIDRDLEGMFV